MPFLTNRQNDWMKKLFGVRRRRGDPDGTPDRVQDTIVPTFDGLGWLDYQNELGESIDGALGATNVTSPLVAQGKVRIYTYVSAHHTDPVARELFIARSLFHGQSGPARNVVLTPYHAGTATGAWPQFRDIVVPRAIIMPEASQFIVIANGMAAGARLELQTQYVELDIGAYIPGVAL